MDYHLNLEQFNGPFDKLLELVEEKKLEITTINLAEVTADFLSYLKTLQDTNPRLLADFIVVASRLMLIKSKVLLPDLRLTEEEEEEIKDLEFRLKIYGEIKASFRHVKELLEKEEASFSRQSLLGVPEVFYPSPSVNTENLLAAAGKLLKILKETSMESSAIENTMISLEEKMEELFKRIQSEVNFRDLSVTRARGDVVLLFLAMLHLVKDGLIAIRQEGQFSDIILNKQNAKS